MASTASIGYHLLDTIEPVVKFYPDGVESSTNPYAAVNITDNLTLFVNTPQQAQALAQAFADVARRFAEVSTS